MASRSTTSAHRRRAVAVNENSLRTHRDGSINVICTRLPLNDHAPGHLSGRRPHRPVRNPAVTTPTGIKIEADGGVDTFKMDFIRSPSHSRSTPPHRAAATGPTRVGGRRATSPMAWLIARRRSTGPRRGESFGAQHGHPPRRGPQNARSPTIRSYRPCCPQTPCGHWRSLAPRRADGASPAAASIAACTRPHPPELFDRRHPRVNVVAAGRFPDPVVAEGALRRRYITIFRTQSIVSVVLHNANERSCGHDDGAEEADQRRQIWLPPVARADEAAVPPAEVHSCHAHHQ